VKQNAHVKRQAKLHILKMWRRFFHPIMRIIGLKMQDVERAADAAAGLRNVMSGEMSTEGWEKVEDELAKAYEFRAFESFQDPAGMRAAADYTDEWCAAQ